MKNTTKKNSQKQIFFQLFLAVPVSLMVFLTLILLLLLGFEVAYADRVYPGIYIHDLDVSGMTLEEADQVLAEALQYAYQGQLQLTFQDQVWDVRPIDLGYHIDHSTSAQNAYKMGRRGWLPLNMIQKFRAWFSGVQLSPVVFYDERIALDYVQSIASEINRPVVEASLRLENANVVVVDGQVGREVDVSGTLSLIKPALSLMQSVDIPVIVTEQQPVIMDVGLQADLETLASMLVIARVEQDQAENDVYQISINKDLFNVYLSSLAPSLSVSPVNARFIFNDDTSLLEVIEPAVIGRELDVEGSKEHINRQLLAGAQEIELQFNALPPQVTDEATGEELGIIEEITQYTSYFHVFDPPRVQNIAAAAARFHGLLVAPGETFSMVQALGDISLDNGYAEAPIIFGGRTIQGIGGGVCQVSTTLFRAAFFAGFPIVERHPHSYRVGYYEQRPDGSRNPGLAGLDASVYVPIVDLKFTNDTDHWLLMETYPGSVSLTWKFYSTSDGRTVDWNTTGLTNIVPAPETLYRENPELAKGETKRVDYANDGADVRVNRTVYINDQIHFSDSYFTRYQAWQEIIEYGPGTEGIPGVSD